MNEKGGLIKGSKLGNVALEARGVKNGNKRQVAKLSDRATFEAVQQFLTEFRLNWSLHLVTDNAKQLSIDGLPDEERLKLKSHDVWYIKIIDGVISEPYDNDWEPLKKNVYFHYRDVIFIYPELKQKST